MSYNHMVVTKDRDGRFMSYAELARRKIAEAKERESAECERLSKVLGTRLGNEDPAVSDQEFEARWESFWATVPDAAENCDIIKLIKAKLAELG